MGALPSCVGADAFVRPAEQSDAWGMRKAPRPREGVHRVADLIARLARNLGRMRPGLHRFSFGFHPLHAGQE